MHPWKRYFDAKLLEEMFPNQFECLGEQLFELIHPYLKTDKKTSPLYDEHEVVLITYGDSILSNNEKPLKTFKRFAHNYLNGYVSAIHLLPVYPYTSDDGFSVVDYLKIDENLGEWKDIEVIGNEFDLMLDAVINHISKESTWFKKYQKNIEPYNHFFIEKQMDFDTARVTRPRALPLFHRYETISGPKDLWTTFSEDQIDLNYDSIELIIEIAKVLLNYCQHGAKYIRLDAIGFACKRSGTTCMHLKQTHDIIKIYRRMLDYCFDHVKLITETNVPHIDNISYFGNGQDEAHMVYQFPLPPLTLFSFITEDTTKLVSWLSDIHPPSKETTFFNFLASHDGIGMRPVEDLLTEEEKNLMIDRTIQNEGRIGYKNNADGTKSVYELNINYMDALKKNGFSEEEHINAFIASQSILLSVQGVPGIYIHSLLGSSNDQRGLESSGIKRRINREKLRYNDVETQISKRNRRGKVFERYTHLLDIRRQEHAFSPMEKQEIIESESELFTIIRGHTEPILVIVNVSSREICSKYLSKYNGIDRITGEYFTGENIISPFEVRWVKLREYE